ncbi:formylglycine-generating enzyme family protein [Psychrobacter sp. I-STPA6b]|uniref:formylglycine-generating enzyme family protein n=1 Tax=Psychrobacter sp. I-STPA6b TaxID=2585718 RepID=UPI001D0C9D29|nr:SUMF1/EgtB/PvdO family nonheme iron enzyme [Psychrobacter sp. I-STPA6b]
MSLKPTLLLACISYISLTACAQEVHLDDNGIPQTRNNLTQEEQQQLEQFLAQQKANMRFIEGGSFEMGDFGHKITFDGFPLSGYPENKPLHPVTLDSFSMNAYKATYADFDIYSMATGQEKVGLQEYTIEIRQPNAAAGINWYDAQSYCQWLGQQLAVPMSLPTEAQWEYAARNRGEYILFPTDTGLIDPERNVWSFEQTQALSSKYNTSLVVPLVGLYPPNPLGLYDMINQNYEWMLDWYDPNYYAVSPEYNPQGPATGTERVLRGVDANEGDASNIQAIGQTTTGRYKRAPNPPLIMNDPKLNQNVSTSARCVANSPQPLN